MEPSYTARLENIIERCYWKYYVRKVFDEAMSSLHLLQIGERCVRTNKTLVSLSKIYFARRRD